MRMAAPLVSSDVDNNYCWRRSIASSSSPPPPPPMDRPPANVLAGPDATRVTTPAPGVSSKGFGGSGCRKTSQKWCCGTEQCPMCHKFRKLFHCKTCVVNGDFGHSSAAYDKGRSVQFCKPFLVHLSDGFPQTFLYSWFSNNILANV